MTIHAECRFLAMGARRMIERYANMASNGNSPRDESPRTFLWTMNERVSGMHIIGTVNGDETRNQQT